MLETRRTFKTLSDADVQLVSDELLLGLGLCFTFSSSPIHGEEIASYF